VSRGVSTHNQQGHVTASKRAQPLTPPRDRAYHRGSSYRPSTLQDAGM
jgi:hypothetical protein